MLFPRLNTLTLPTGFQARTATNTARTWNYPSKALILLRVHPANYPAIDAVSDPAMASASDIISLDDFETKLPPWDPHGSNHLYAIVDMGRFVPL